MEKGEEENQGLPSHLRHHVNCRQGNGKAIGAKENGFIIKSTAELRHDVIASVPLIQVFRKKWLMGYTCLTGII